MTDNRLYIENCLKIINKEGQLVPFKLNAGQIIVDNVIKELEAKNKELDVLKKELNSIVEEVDKIINNITK